MELVTRSDIQFSRNENVKGRSLIALYIKVRHSAGVGWIMKGWVLPVYIVSPFNSRLERCDLYTTISYVFICVSAPLLDSSVCACQNFSLWKRISSFPPLGELLLFVHFDVCLKLRKSWCDRDYCGITLR